MPLTVAAPPNRPGPDTLEIAGGDGHGQDVSIPDGIVIASDSMIGPTAEETGKETPKETPKQTAKQTGKGSAGYEHWIATGFE
jgi:hypothetical protein